MDKALYIAMSGARQNMLGQSIHANNLANVNTTGFRADFEQARSMPVFGEHFPTRAYAMTERPGHRLTSGPLEETGNAMDVAIKGEGWLAVQAPDGSEAYTRDGRLSLSSTGLLVTATGLPVMGENGPIVLPDFEQIEIGSDGTITIRPIGQGPQEIAEVDRLKLVNPDADALGKQTDGLFHLKEGGEAEPDGAVAVVSGFLERSNVNAVESMISIMSLARQFELQVKMMGSVEENGRQSAQLLQFNS